MLVLHVAGARRRVGPEGREFEAWALGAGIGSFSIDGVANQPRPSLLKGWEGVKCALGCGWASSRAGV